MEKEVNCLNSKVILGYVKEHNNGDYSGLLKNLAPEIDALSDPERFLIDPNNWISCAVASKLYERARMILKDELAAYKIAKYAVEKAKLGYAQRIIAKGFWSYKTGLKHVQKLNDKWNRNKRVELVEIRRNGAILKLH